MTGTPAEDGKRGRLGIYSLGSFPVAPPIPHHSLSLQIPFILPFLCLLGCRPLIALLPLAPAHTFVNSLLHK